MLTMATVLLLFALLCINLNTVEADSSCDDKCEWTVWSSWSDCDRRCAGGHQRRSREFCCKHGLELRECMKDCKLDYDVMSSRFRDTKSCNQLCYNGGTFMSSYFGYCRCPTRYRGTCCEDGVYVYIFVI